MTDYGIYRADKKEKEKFFLMAGAAVFAVAYCFYHSLILSALVLLCLPKLLKIYEEHMAEKRRKELRNQFKDVLYSLSASFAAGRQMSSALEEAAENLELLYSPDADMVKELKYIVRGVKESKRSEDELLADFAGRSRVEDMENFVEVYLTCKSTGADTERVVANAAENLMDKMEIEKSIEAMAVQKLLEGRIICAMPVAVVLLLNLISPDYLALLYSGLAGRLTMSAALMVNAVAYYSMTRLMKIEV